MPVAWRYQDDILAISIIGVIENKDIVEAFRCALSTRQPATALGLLWDARQSQTPLSSDDVAWRIELVSSLAARGHFSRAAILGRGDHGTVFLAWVRELPKISQTIPFRAFTDELEALTWLRGSEGVSASASAPRAAASQEQSGRPTRS